MQGFDTLPYVTVIRETAVTPAAIWTVLSDLPALPEWASGIEGAEVTATLQALEMRARMTF